MGVNLAWVAEGTYVEVPLIERKYLATWLTNDYGIRHTEVTDIKTFQRSDAGYVDNEDIVFIQELSFGETYYHEESNHFITRIL